MRISPAINSPRVYSFGSGSNTPKNNGTSDNNNPISKTGEKALLVKATFLGGLALGWKLLLEVPEMFDDSKVIEHVVDGAEKIVERQHKRVSENKKLVLTLAASAGLIAMAVSGFALLYTIFNAPKIKYNGNVNAFKKGKEMDVYIKGNAVEKELYTQMNEKAKGANEEEKAKLKEQYMQMQMAKNRIPDFIRN